MAPPGGTARRNRPASRLRCLASCLCHLVHLLRRGVRGAADARPRACYLSRSDTPRLPIARFSPAPRDQSEHIVQAHVAQRLAGTQSEIIAMVAWRLGFVYLQMAGCRSLPIMSWFALSGLERCQWRVQHSQECCYDCCLLNEQIC